MKRALLLFSLMIFGLALNASEQPDHSIWDRLVHSYVKSSGKVNYQGLKIKQDTLDEYLLELKKHGPQSDWTKNEKKAYYMNAYNAYTVKFVLRKYPVKSVNDMSFSGKDLWHVKLVALGDKVMTLDYLENEILRKMGDARIHFGINCASYSCPKLYNHAFTGKNVNSALTKLTKAYINDPRHNDISAKKIKISELFKWYMEDFTKDDQTLVQFLNKYSNVTINADAKIEYLPYNWTLNENL